MFCVPDEALRVAGVCGSPPAAVSSAPHYHGALRKDAARAGADVANPPDEADLLELAHLSPEQLVEKSEAGCRDSFELLVKHYEARIFNFLFRMTRSRHDAEDLTQETFLKAYRNFHRYNPAYSFATWLFTIAKRTAVSHFRAARPTGEIPHNSEAADADPSLVLAEKDELRSVWQLAETLKPKQFEALWLRYGEGFPIGEVARIMRLTRIHVKVLLHRGRNRLAELLAKRRPTPSRESPSMVIN